MMYMHVKTKHHLQQTSKLYKCMSKSPLNGGYEIKCTKTHQLLNNGGIQAIQHCIVGCLPVIHTRNYNECVKHCSQQLSC